MKRRWLWLAIFALCTLACFSPIISASLWHLRNGNTVVYDGRQVHVPFFWTADADTGSVHTLRVSYQSMDRMGTNIGRPQIGALFFHFQQQAGRLNAGVDFHKLGLTVTGPTHISTLTGDALCYEGTDATQPNNLEVACSSTAGGWDSFFDGDRRLASQAEGIVRSMTSVH